MGNENSSRDRLQTPNLVTVIMLALSLVMCCAIAAALVFWPKGESSLSRNEEPTVFVLPTFTQRPIGPTLDTGAPAEDGSEATQRPTLDLSTALPSQTPLPSSTRQPTETPTPTNTFTPTSTFTATATFTRLPFDYVLRNNAVTFSSSETWHAAEECNWQSIAGVVFDQSSKHVTGLLIHVWRDGEIDTRVATGSTTLFGASGWEVKIDDVINGHVYYVQIESPGYDKLSDAIRVDFSNSCSGNFAFLTFDKVQ